MTVRDDSSYVFGAASSKRRPAARRDVVILGTGIASSFLAALLGRQGLDVLVVDHSTHPKFAVGESMVPYLTAVWHGLAEQYDVPELSPLRLREDLAASVGVKANFGFVYHRPGERAVPAEMLQHANPARREMHLFRQDVDARMVYDAIRHGVDFRFNTTVASVEIRHDRVLITLGGGDSLESQYVVDGTGFRSILANGMRLRDRVPRLRTRSASCFTHMIDVEPFDAIREGDWHGMKGRFAEGTLHHVFRDGWLWVIPFNNTDRSRNPVISVGLQLNLRRRRLGAAPGPKEVIDLVKSLPDVQRQFRNAKAVRPWVSARRLQYSSSSCVGHRYCLLPHAYGFVDPLYSRGLCFAFDGIKALVPPLLESVRAGDFSDEHFRPLDRLYATLLAHHDQLVHGSYLSFQNVGLWRNWYEFWNLSTSAGERPLVRAATRGLETGDFTDFDRCDHKGAMGAYEERMESACQVMAAAEAGTLSMDAAVEMVAALSRTSWSHYRHSTQERGAGAVARRGVQRRSV